MQAVRGVAATHVDHAQRPVARQIERCGDDRRQGPRHILEAVDEIAHPVAGGLVAAVLLRPHAGAHRLGQAAPAPVKRGLQPDAARHRSGHRRQQASGNQGLVTELILGFVQQSERGCSIEQQFYAAGIGANLVRHY